MRRSLLYLTAAMIVLIALSGCGQKNTASDTSGSASDSLLSTSPIEPSAGNITPQTQMPEQTPAQEPPAQSTTTHKPKPAPSSGTAQAKDTGVSVDAGTPINIGVSTQISSETANVGDTWSGEVKENVIVGDRVVFPAGSVVSGTVTGAKPAEKGSRAMLDLAVTAVSVNGKSHSVDATMEPIEAGSTRARNLGAVAGGAAAGALIGKAVGGGGKGALIGAIAGGAAAGAGVAASKGYQVVLKEGTVLTFKVKDTVKIRS
jgi:hypothetical protein